MLYCWVRNILIVFHEQEVHDYLKSLCPDMHVTRGEYDEDSPYLETKTLTIGQFKLGVCHGHQVGLVFRCLFFVLTWRVAQIIVLPHNFYKLDSNVSTCVR